MATQGSARGGGHRGPQAQEDGDSASMGRRSGNLQMPFDPKEGWMDWEKRLVARWKRRRREVIKKKAVRNLNGRAQGSCPRNTAYLVFKTLLSTGFSPQGVLSSRDAWVMPPDQIVPF